MTQPGTNDGLLKAATILSTTLQILLAGFMIGLIVALPIFFFSQSHVADAMLPDGSWSIGTVLSAIAITLVLGIALAGLALHFLTVLKQIIGSVAAGDPFAPANAARISRLGWIVLAIEGVKVPARTAVNLLSTQFPPDTIELEIGFVPEAILLALVLFVLARVFETGTRMRADLEGTV